MFHRLFRLFKPTLNSYTPVRHSFFRDEAIADRLHKEGYCVVDFVDQDQINLLSEIYKVEHNLNAESGGMFLSTFSKDVTYRNRIHLSIQKILRQSFENWFFNYDDNTNSFVVKMPGKDSHFILHQDMAAVDETKHSLLNIWTPLQDIDSVNGALYLVPQSHNIFSPYRCPTVPPIIKNIQSELYDYAVPIYLKLGQAVFFDPRIFHYSIPNLSVAPRVVVVSRILPKKADVVVYYNDNPSDKTIVEKWRCPKDYFISGGAYSDDIRPEGCEFIGYENYPSPLTIGEFNSIKIKMGLRKQNHIIDRYDHQPDFIREPKN